MFYYLSVGRFICKDPLNLKSFAPLELASAFCSLLCRMALRIEKKSANIGSGNPCALGGGNPHAVKQIISDID